jgi:hypothetical protein
MKLNLLALLLPYCPQAQAAEDQRLASCFEDRSFQQPLDDFLLVGRELRDSFKLQTKIAVGTALICTENQDICAHLQSDWEPSNHVERGREASMTPRIV